MKMFLTGSALGALALVGTAATAQQAPKPKIEAVYWLSAETLSGMATGRPGGVEKDLSLQLGSARTNPSPDAAHLPPQALRAGDRLPLVSPRGAPPRADGTPDYRPKQGDAPKGRIELYWGCGEAAPAGQPVIIDLATMKPGAASPFGAIPQVKPMVPPSAGRHATYGEWPGGKNSTRVPRAASLVGDHVVQGNYSPEMRFAVAAGNDFLAPLSPKSDKLASGAVKVGWPAIQNARGYIMSVTGARADGTIVMWTSSAVRMPAMALPDYLEQSDIARFVQQRILLAPQATECVVPSAVGKASESAMLMMTAYGPEANYGSPREAVAGWGVKLRTKSSHMGMLGVDIASLMAGGDSEDADDDVPASEAKPKKKRGLLRGVIGGALGLPG